MTPPTINPLFLWALALTAAVCINAIATAYIAYTFSKTATVGEVVNSAICKDI